MLWALPSPSKASGCIWFVLVLVNVNEFGTIFVEALGGAPYAGAQAAADGAVKERPPVEQRIREVHPLRECLVCKVHKTL